MLGKLLKYDCKELSKTFLPLYAVILAMSLLDAISLRFDWFYALFGVSTIIFGLFMALGIITVVLAISQFYHSILSDQGYLNNTLPVKTGTLVLSKLFSSLIWMFFSAVTAVLSLAILLLGSLSFGEIQEFFSACWQLIQAVFDYMSTSNGLVNVLIFILCALLLILLVFAGLANEVLHLYLSMACSQLRPFCRNRIAGSFIAYFLISIPTAILTAVGATGMAALTKILNLWQTLSAPGFVIFVLVSSLLGMMLLNLLFYIPACYILKNKLNLE